MCGLAGWDLDHTKISKTQRRVLASTLMMGNDDRGGHAWGYWSPDWDKETLPIKGLGYISNNVRAKRLAEIPRIMIHTRFASSGCHKDIDNAHPFVCGNVIGAHNGCLSNKDMLDKWYRECEVDSQHIFWHLNDGLNLLDIEAYGAVEFCLLDQPDKIYLSSFNNGDLAIAKVKAGVVWSSCKTTLAQCLRLSGMKYTLYIVEEDQLYFVQDRGLWDSQTQLLFSPYRSFAKWDSTRYKTTSLVQDDTDLYEQTWNHGVPLDESLDLDDYDKALLEYEREMRDDREEDPSRVGD